MSLYDFVSEILIRIGEESYFGKELHEVEPQMIDHFKVFDTLSWQVLYQYPSFLCGTMLNAKKKMQSAFERYFSMPIEARRNSAWMILQLEKDMKRLHVSLHDMSLSYFQLY